jgi:hypothetical protein
MAQKTLNWKPVRSKPRRLCRRRHFRLIHQERQFQLLRVVP